MVLVLSIWEGEISFSKIFCMSSGEILYSLGVFLFVRLMIQYAGLLKGWVLLWIKQCGKNAMYLCGILGFYALITLYFIVFADGIDGIFRTN